MTGTICFRTNSAWKIVIIKKARHMFTVSETLVDPFLYESKNILIGF